MNLDLSTTAPPSPERTLQLAEALAEAARVLCYMTRHHEALQYPSEAGSVLGDLALMASRLPQLLGQIGAWLGDEHAGGRIQMTGGEFPQSLTAVMAVRARLESAGEIAGELRAMLASAAEVTACMAVSEDGGSDEGSG